MHVFVLVLMILNPSDAAIGSLPAHTATVVPQALAFADAKDCGEKIPGLMQAMQDKYPNLHFQATCVDVTAAPEEPKAPNALPKNRFDGTEQIAEPINYTPTPNHSPAEHAPRSATGFTQCTPQGERVVIAVVIVMADGTVVRYDHDHMHGLSLQALLDLAGTAKDQLVYGVDCNGTAV